jgi:hypothetical protein
MFLDFYVFLRNYKKNGIWYIFRDKFFIHKNYLEVKAKRKD